jgi:hypothetical protein
MKKKDIWISVTIIGVALLATCIYSQRQGYVQLDTNGARAELRLRSGWFGRVAVKSDTEPTAVKARSYRPQSLRITSTANARRRSVRASGPWGKLNTVNVKNNETTVLKVGPPFLVKPRVHRRGSRVTVGVAILGQAGEHYNARQFSAPSLRIVDKAGNVLAAGKLQYG